jgi:hypothetical protein
MRTLGTIDWESISESLTNVSGAAQGVATAAQGISNVYNTLNTSNAAAQYLQPVQTIVVPGGSNNSNTTKYVVFAAVGVTLFGGLFYVLTRKKSKKK